MRALSRFRLSPLSFGLMLLTTAGLSACGQHRKPNTIYMPNMVYAPSYKAGEIEVMRLKPPAGVIPRSGWVPYKYASDMTGLDAEKGLKNPVAKTRENLYLGKALFASYCLPCHGPLGAGDGPVTQKGMIPMPINTDRVNAFSDGIIFHWITNGRNLMPSYAPQTTEEERWTIINYVRVLHKAKNPTQEDLKRLENW